jgi:hypothetical protein
MKMSWPLTRRQWVLSFVLGTVTLVAIVAFAMSDHPAGVGFALAWPVLFRFAPFARLDADAEGDEGS